MQFLGMGRGNITIMSRYRLKMPSKPARLKEVPRVFSNLQLQAPT